MESREDSPVTVSVVICTKDRPQALAECLASLARQSVLPTELIVVDAGTTTRGDPLAGFAARTAGVRDVLHLFSEPGLPRQRNLGARAARGDVVLFLDDDTVLDRGYVEAIVAVYASDGDRRIGGVGGALCPDPTPREGALRRAARRAFLLQGHGRGRVKRSGHPEFAFAPAEQLEVEFLSGCNMSFRREVFAEIAFDERLSGYAVGEDLHFSYAVSRRWKLVVTPHARVDHREVAGGRPPGAARAEMAVLNRFLFVREQLARGPIDWLCFAWAAIGDLLWTMRHPAGGQLAGRVRGYTRVLAGAVRLRGGAAPGGTEIARVREPMHAEGAAIDGSPSEQPLVSVVVPARDEEGFIGTCIDSLLAQTYAAERTEILVVDNGSSDRTPDIVARYAADDPRVRLLRCDGANQAAGMNLGVAEASGGIVVRVDAHGFVAPDYVTRVVGALARHPDVVAVGGPYLPTGDRLLERVAALARGSRVGVGGGWYSDKGAGEHRVRTVGCPAYRRQAILDAGSFDPAMAFGEDDELHWRLQKRGGGILFSPELRQYNRPRASFRALARQYWNYGRGRLRVLRKHPDFLLPRHLVPSLFVAVLLALVPVAAFVPAGRAALLALAGAYAIALAVAGTAAAEHGWREALLVPCAVGIIHVAYGGGMLCGAMVGWVAPAPHHRKGIR